MGSNPTPSAYRARFRMTGRIAGIGSGTDRSAAEVNESQQKAVSWGFRSLDVPSGGPGGPLLKSSPRCSRSNSNRPDCIYGFSWLRKAARRAKPPRPMGGAVGSRGVLPDANWVSGPDASSLAALIEERWRQTSQLQQGISARAEILRLQAAEIHSRGFRGVALALADRYEGGHRDSPSFRVVLRLQHFWAPSPRDAGGKGQDRGGGGASVLAAGQLSDRWLIVPIRQSVDSRNAAGRPPRRSFAGTIAAFTGCESLNEPTFVDGGENVPEIFEDLIQGEMNDRLQRGASSAGQTSSAEDPQRLMQTQACTASAGCPPPSNGCHTMGCR